MEAGTYDPFAPGGDAVGVRAPDAGQESLVVKAVRLGQGGFVVTVSPPEDPAPEAERLITLTVATRLSKRGRSASHNAGRQPAAGPVSRPAQVLAGS
jgi:hypothetical protein